MRDEFLWVEKYRPKTVSETILPKEIKATFQQFVDQKNVPNLILSGKAGTGKTTIARAMLEELGCDYIIINGSMKGNIDTLRNEIMQFASSVSLNTDGGRKYVILDEADYLNPNSTQPALRNFMEEFSHNCGFILTCNFKNRIIAPLHSRCSVIEFKIPKEQKQAIVIEFFKRVCSILQKENITFDKNVVGEVIKKYFPDWRRILNELQRYSSSGTLSNDAILYMRETTISDLVSLMKEKDFTKVRKWVSENEDVDMNTLFRSLYDKVSQFVTTATIPHLIVTLADYQYKSAFVADQQINLAACLAEIMGNCEFKGDQDV